MDAAKVKKRPAHRPRELEGGKRVNVYLDAPSLLIAQHLGEGNTSEGIRRALAQVLASELAKESQD